MHLAVTLFGVCLLTEIPLMSLIQRVRSRLGEATTVKIVAETSQLQIYNLAESSDSATSPISVTYFERNSTAVISK